MFDVKIMYMPNEKDDKKFVDETEYRKRQSQDIKVGNIDWNKKYTTVLMMDLQMADLNT